MDMHIILVKWSMAMLQQILQPNACKNATLNPIVHFGTSVAPGTPVDYVQTREMEQRLLNHSLLVRNFAILVRFYHILFNLVFRDFICTQ